MKRYGCDADLGVVMRAWFLRIFHDATSGRRGACFALIFFMKKNRARNLVQSPVQKLAEKGGFEPPRPLFGPAPLAGVCIRPLCHFSAEILPHAIAVDAYHRRDVLVSVVGSD